LWPAALWLAVVRQSSLEAEKVLPDAAEAAFVLNLKFLNIVPQFPVGIAIRAHGDSYIKFAALFRVGKTLPTSILPEPRVYDPQHVRVSNHCWLKALRKAIFELQTLQRVQKNVLRIVSSFLLLWLAGNLAASEADDLASVEQRVRELQPKADEKHFDEIGWADDIRDAIHLAKESHRPVFLFTHDGRMNIGRC
jgi:hypothetical protein